MNDFNEKIQIDTKEFEIWTKEITDNLNYPGARSSKPNKLDFMERAADVYFVNFNCNICFILWIFIFEGAKIYKNEQEKMKWDNNVFTKIVFEGST